MTTTAVRLDKLLVDRGLAGSRHRAELLIRERLVTVNGAVVERTGKKFDPEVDIALTGTGLQWVSRGALKLVAALEQWPKDLTDLPCLDIGASTGGFTEVMLDRGAKHVYAVDTGHSQLASHLAEDKRVTNLEKTNIRHLETLPERVSFTVIDVSFISLTYVLPTLPRFLSPEAVVYALVKPQFEVGRANLTKKGIVRSEKLYDGVLDTIRSTAKEHDLKYYGHIPSPIKGGDGNTEFLIHLQYSKS